MALTPINILHIYSIY